MASDVRPAPMIWSQSREGRAVDLVAPRAEQVDFAEIAQTLARVGRWCGAAKPWFSVAHHTLIGLPLCRRVAPEHPTLCAYWLLHDAHEARTGDLTRPVQLALAEIAGEEDPRFARVVRTAWRELQRRHDVAIWQAAGLPPIDMATDMLVRRIDDAAMMIERRDLLAAPPLPWTDDLEALALEPLVTETPSAFHISRLRDGAAADRLDDAFRAHLPAFRHAARPAQA